MYFYGSFLAGPAVEVKEYIEFTNLSMFKNGRIPSTILPALQVFFFCLVCFGFTNVKAMYPASYMTSPEFFTSFNYLQRFFYMQLSVSLHRFQYYFIWLLAEGACVLAGLGYVYNQKEDKVTWDRCSNVDIIALETCQNYKGITDAWNKKTNLWLKYYIYFRLSAPDGKATTAATYITYLTSAFWHVSAFQKTSCPPENFCVQLFFFPVGFLSWVLHDLLHRCGVHHPGSWPQAEDSPQVHD